MAQIRLRLRTLNAMPQFDMRDFVADCFRKRVFTAHQVDQSAANKNMTAWYRERVNEISLRHQMKLVLKAALRVRCNSLSDFIDVCLCLKRRVVPRRAGLKYGF